MDFLRAVLGLAPRRVQPAQVATDEIFPATFFDDTPLNRSVLLYLTFRFNNVLDTVSLRESLSRLLEIDGWRKLGGRFRLNPAGKLEIHIPQKFTADRPAIGYSEESFDVGINEHPLASQLPRPAKGHQYVQAGPRTFFPLAKSERMPATFLDFVYSDAPQLSIHIIKFTDTTLVSLSWCHVTTDAVGMGAILRAWSLVLAGRQDEVPPMMLLRDDPLDQLGTEQESGGRGEEELVMASKLLTLPNMIALALRFFIFDPWLYGRMEEHMVFVPRTTTQKLKTAALSTLSADMGNDIVLDSETGNPFLTSGDVITAWFAAMASSVLGLSSRRSVLIFNPFDIRGRLRKLFPGSRDKAAYVQNATLNYFILAPAKQVVPAGTDHVALGRFAATIRYALVQQTTVPQIRAMIRLYRDTIAKTGNSPMFGDSNSYAMLFSNWTRARFFEVMDFSPAVLPSRAERRNVDGDWLETTSGRPVYYHSQSLMPGPRTNRNWLCINGNVEGDYWVHGYLLPGVWMKIEDALEKFDVD
ncbi:Lysr family regulatory protein [Pleurostoma richardsiae]|uniref:Lysr family regulatory protein n=1 Tax=Pleurostoma richardsiae TaxID=41990 RepID=A0AA38R6S6_9PEZI|nr:Lysr family regulatory protein [Pleurostoma richardsiae]